MVDGGARDYDLTPNTTTTVSWPSSRGPLHTFPSGHGDLASSPSAIATAMYIALFAFIGIIFLVFAYYKCCPAFRTTPPPSARVDIPAEVSFEAFREAHGKDDGNGTRETT